MTNNTFKLKTHQNIKIILDNLNKDFLSNNKCYFGGGTALSLLLNEYRESRDIDFLCSSKDGFRELRSTSSNLTLGNIFSENSVISYEREIIQNRDKIKTILGFGDQKIKIEFVKMEEFNASGEFNNFLGLEVLDKESLFVSKLLANANRGIDKSTNSRDLIDLAIMIENWGLPSNKTIKKAIDLYDKHLIKGFNGSKKVIEDKNYLLDCLDILKMDKKWEKIITKNTNSLASVIINTFDVNQNMNIKNQFKI